MKQTRKLVVSFSNGQAVSSSDIYATEAACTCKEYYAGDRDLERGGEDDVSSSSSSSSLSPLSDPSLCWNVCARLS